MKQTIITIFFLGLAAASGANAAREYDGQLQFARRAELGIPVSGVVQNVPVNVADRVKKGQVLLSLDPRPFRAMVDEARAAVDHAEQSLQEAQRELDRAKELYDRTVLSNTELEQAQTAYQTRKADWDSTKARLLQAQVDSGYSTLRAPFDGMVAQRHVEVGQTIVSRLQAQPLVVLVDNQHMFARIQARSDELDQFIEGNSVMVKVGPQVYSGRIAKIGLEPVRTQEGVAEYEIDVEIVSGEQLLRAGQNVKVVLP